MLSNLNTSLVSGEMAELASSVVDVITDVTGALLAVTSEEDIFPSDLNTTLAIISDITE